MLILRMNSAMRTFRKLTACVLFSLVCFQAFGAIQQGRRFPDGVELGTGAVDLINCTAEVEGLLTYFQGIVMVCQGNGNWTSLESSSTPLSLTSKLDDILTQLRPQNLQSSVFCSGNGEYNVSLDACTCFSDASNGFYSGLRCGVCAEGFDWDDSVPLPRCLRDTIPPEISLVGDAAVTVEATVDYVDAGAAATDNIDGALVPFVTHNDVNVHQLGTYTVEWSAEDSSDNVVSVTRTVTVEDSTAPVLTLDGSVTFTLEAGDAFVEPGYSALDALEDDLTSAVVGPGSPDTTNVGIVELGYAVQDSSGNSAQASRFMTVVDTTSPVLTLLGDDSVTVEAGDVFTDPGYNAVDIADDAVQSSVLREDSLDTSVVGAYVLTYTATDASGNVATASRNVTVQDTLSPVIALYVTDHCGDSQVNAAVSCDSIQSRCGPSGSSGTFWVDADADGDTSNAIQVTCNFAMDGGGWTLLQHGYHGNPNTPSTWFTTTTSKTFTTTDFEFVSIFPTDSYGLLKRATEVLYEYHDKSGNAPSTQAYQAVKAVGDFSSLSPSGSQSAACVDVTSVDIETGSTIASGPKLCFGTCSSYATALRFETYRDASYYGELCHTNTYGNDLSNVLDFSFFGPGHVGLGTIASSGMGISANAHVYNIYVRGYNPSPSSILGSSVLYVEQYELNATVPNVEAYAGDNGYYSSLPAFGDVPPASLPVNGPTFYYEVSEGGHIDTSTVGSYIKSFDFVDGSGNAAATAMYTVHVAAVDECAHGLHSCDANADCVDNPTNYSCSCVSGYSGDGFTCVDVDECLTGSHSCDANAVCSNTAGSYSCECEAGYSGDGFTCIEACGDIPSSPAESCTYIKQFCNPSGNTGQYYVQVYDSLPAELVTCAFDIDATRGYLLVHHGYNGHPTTAANWFTVTTASWTVPDRYVASNFINFMARRDWELITQGTAIVFEYYDISGQLSYGHQRVKATSSSGFGGLVPPSNGLCIAVKSTELTGTQRVINQGSGPILCLGGCGGYETALRFDTYRDGGYYNTLCHTNTYGNNGHNHQNLDFAFFPNSNNPYAGIGTVNTQGWGANAFAHVYNIYFEN